MDIQTTKYVWSVAEHFDTFQQNHDSEYEDIIEDGGKEWNIGCTMDNLIEHNGVIIDYLFRFTRDDNDADTVVDAMNLIQEISNLWKKV